MSTLDGGDHNAVASGGEETCRRFSFVEIRSMTNNFDDASVIGIGGFGNVYKGSIDDGAATTVAIKRLKAESKQGAEEFWTEVKLLSKLQHNHLVPLIGHCNGSEEMILVYEYMAHGTLADHLYKLSRKESGDSTSNHHLAWEQRLGICIGAARGLDYLHTGTNQTFIHRDVKTTNILLDEKWVAKIADFGLTKAITSHSATHITTIVKGSFGYLDPNYFHTYRLTKKSDVYAFGVVLLEVLCGRPPVDTTLEEEQIGLVFWAQLNIKKGKLDRIIDPFLGGHISPRCLKYFVELANDCVHERPKDRPTMSQVVRCLELALGSQGRGRKEGIIIKMFQGMNGWWSEKKEDDGSKVEKKEDDGSEVEKKEDDGSKVEKKEDDGSKVEKKEDALEKKEDDGSEVEKKEDDGSKVEKKEDDGSKVEKKEDDGSKVELSKDPSWEPPSSGSVTPKPYRQFSLAEIRASTHDFDENLVIEKGLSGKVYKGLVDDGTLVVAIKRLRNDEFGAKEFKVETEVLSTLYHPNVASLIGFCKEEHELILVYDYMVNGSFRAHLDEKGINDPSLWKKRLKICIDVARGLQYLHTGTRHCILHRNIISSNILLDSNWVAKITCFASSKREVRDDSGDHRKYFDPQLRYDYTEPPSEYRVTHEDYIFLITKDDVGSFGDLLLEVLCPKKYRVPYSSMARDTVIDPDLIGQIAPKCLEEFSFIASSCHKDGRRTRRPLKNVNDVAEPLKNDVVEPLMNNVVERLEHALKLQEAWDFACVCEREEKVGMDFFSGMPDGFVSDIISLLTSPRDVCRSSAISSGFKSVADSDSVWDKLLPSDHLEIISRSVSPVAFSTKKQLYFRLADSPLLIDGGKRCFSLDKESGKKCFMLGARQLLIIWGNSPEYWRRSLPQSRFSEVAELRTVSWFHIAGKIDARLLSPKTTYVAYLVFIIQPRNYGFDSLPAKASVRFSGVIGDEDESTSTVYVKLGQSGPDPSAPHGRLPQGRKDGWMEIELGEFFNDQGESGEVEMQLKEVERGNLKSGFIVEGIELRPKVDA